MKQGLMPGEPEDVQSYREARHWLHVYADLLNSLTPIAEAHPSAEILDRVVMLSARLRFWVQRAEELEDELERRLEASW